MGLIDSLLGHAGETPVDKLEPELRPLLAAGEPLEAAFTFVRDMIVFTDRRLILINKQGVTILLIEQNANMALKIADIGYVLETGRITLTGSGEELLTNDAVRAAYLGA